MTDQNKQLNTENNNFDPDFYFYKVNKIVVNHLGPEIAMVLAYVENECSYKEQCQDSETIIGDALGISWYKVSKAIESLLEKGLIEEVFHDPDKKKWDKTKWYISKMEAVKSLKLEDIEPIKSNISRRKNQSNDKAKLLEKLDENSPDQNLIISNTKTPDQNLITSDGSPDQNLINRVIKNSTFDCINSDPIVRNSKISKIQNQIGKSDSDADACADSQKSKKNQLIEYLSKTYDCKVPPFIVDDITQGKCKNQNQPISENDALECWQDINDKLRTKNSIGGKALEGLDLLKFHRSLVITEYPQWAASKRARQAEREQIVNQRNLEQEQKEQYKRDAEEKSKQNEIERPKKEQFLSKIDELLSPYSESNLRKILQYGSLSYNDKTKIYQKFGWSAYYCLSNYLNLDTDPFKNFYIDSHELKSIKEVYEFILVVNENFDACMSEIPEEKEEDEFELEYFN